MFTSYATCSSIGARPKLRRPLIFPWFLVETILAQRMRNGRAPISHQTGGFLYSGTFWLLNTKDLEGAIGRLLRPKKPKGSREVLARPARPSTPLSRPRPEPGVWYPPVNIESLDVRDSVSLKGKGCSRTPRSSGSM